MNTTVIRDQIVALLQGGNAHLSFEQALKDFPLKHINSKAAGIPYSAWELVEHMRIAQFDILDFIDNPDYRQPDWPEEYWPAKMIQATADQWQETISNFNRDLSKLMAMAKDPNTDLTSPLKYAPEYNLLREILLVADHNAYHIGQIVSLRRMLNIY